MYNLALKWQYMLQYYLKEALSLLMLCVPVFIIIVWEFCHFSVTHYVVF